MVAAVAAALVILPGTISGGNPVTESGPTGIHLRFIPSRPFGIAVFLQNRSRAPVVVANVRALEPAGTLVHQIGTRLHAWSPSPCPKHTLGCPLRAPPFGPFTPATPKPVRIGPGKQVAVELDFRLGSCAEVPFASAAAPREIEVVTSSGDEFLPLGGARPVLRFPAPADCAKRRYAVRR